MGGSCLCSHELSETYALSRSHLPLHEDQSLTHHSPRHLSTHLPWPLPALPTDLLPVLLTCPGLRHVLPAVTLAPFGNSSPLPNSSGERLCPLAGPGHWDPFIPGRLGMRHPYGAPHSSGTGSALWAAPSQREYHHQPTLPPQWTGSLGHGQSTLPLSKTPL